MLIGVDGGNVSGVSQRGCVTLMARNPKQIWDDGHPLWIIVFKSGKCMSGGSDGVVRYYMDLSWVMDDTTNDLDNYEMTQEEDNPHPSGF